MLKFLFWTLLAANAALFGYQWYAGMPASQGREPARVARQFNAGKVRLLPASAATAAPAAVDPAASSAPAAAPSASDAASAPAAPAANNGAAPPLAAAQPAAGAACAEIGDFDLADAKRFEARLASLSLGDHLAQRKVHDGARFIVFIASGSRDGADKKADELRQMGVKDFYVIQENAGMRWAISLGIFHSEEAAKTHVATLEKKGVRNARVAPFNLPSTRLAYQLRALDAPARQAVDRIATDFPQQQWRACGAPQDGATPAKT